MADVLAEWTLNGDRRRLVLDEFGRPALEGEAKLRGEVVGWVAITPTADDMLAMMGGPPKGLVIVSARAEPALFERDFDRTRDAQFEEFWAAYPKKAKKPDAKKAWKQVYLQLPYPADLMAALARWKASEQWQRGFVHLPATWLRNHIWDDTPPEPSRTAASAPAPTVFIPTNTSNLRARLKN